MRDVRLGEIPLFSGLDRVSLAELIPELEEVAFGAGEILVRQGERGDCLHVILEGDARVCIDSGGEGLREVARLGPGDCFGEMALLTGEARSATVQAAADLVTLKLSRERFDGLLARHNTTALHFARLLARRLSSANAELSRGAREADAPGDGEPDRRADHPRSGEWAREKKTTRPDESASVAVNRKAIAGIAAAAFLCVLAGLLLRGTGLTRPHLVLVELLLAASVFWTLDIFSYHVVSVALPVAAVLFGATTPETAFSGFSTPSWFLVLGVFSLSAAISKTGLLYRLVIMAIRRFPPSYAGNILALASAGLILTPVVPSSNGRAALASPVALAIGRTIRVGKNSPAAVGLAMACLLGFGHMSFLFMNGTATCFLVLGLLPPAIGSHITWGDWARTALPLGIAFFVLSCLAILILYRPKEKIRIDPSVLDAQLATLGPLTTHEKISLATAVLSVVGFLTQPWHQINGAWVAMLSFVILFGSGVLTERMVRTEIDWNFLISFGALLGFGAVIGATGLSSAIAAKAGPYVEHIEENRLLFFLTVSAAIHLLRFLLPLPPTQLIGMLSILPAISMTAINPLLVGLVVLASSNPWILPHQNTIYLSVVYGTEGELFSHRHTLPLAVLHILVVLAAIAVAVPIWSRMGLTG